jgi:F-type H+-transporting ATPase subunit epsilon
MAKIRLQILTADRVVFSGDVDAIIVPGTEGQLGILPDHAPILALLQGGEVTIRIGDEDYYLAISGGMLEMNSNNAIMLAYTAELAEEIDITRAEAARIRSLDRLQHVTGEEDLARDEAALRRALTRIKVADRRKKKRV